jgi:hypothetical protein
MDAAVWVCEATHRPAISLRPSARASQESAMTQDQDIRTPDVPEEDEDVEGNSMIIGASMSTDLARIRSREVEREARQRAQAKEAKDAKDR